LTLKIHNSQNPPNHNFKNKVSHKR